MNSGQWQAEQFEQYRTHLRMVAQRILGSAAEAEDAVQEAWLRLNRADTTEVENIRGWLTTVVSRICLDMLRARQARREELGDGPLREPVVTLFEDHGSHPEHEALLADSVGIAMLIVLETLTPAERLTFVLHDLFGMPFVEIAPIVERSVAATRQLASRARRRVRGAPEPQPESLVQQRRVVEAFLKASREGDFEALVSVLDPSVVFRADAGTTGPVTPPETRGAEEVARIVLTRGAPFAHLGRPAIVNGEPGAVVALPDRIVSVVSFKIEGGRVTELNLLVDPERLRRVRV
jgi:RNA polymerase sigma-70 factor (ECF subfamily)